MRNSPTPAACMPMSSHRSVLMMQTALGAGSLVRAMARRVSGRHAVAPRHLELVGYFEQAPTPHSRVTLDRETDRLGQRKVRVEWHLGALDLHTYRTAAPIFGQELASACNGTFEPAPWLDDPFAPPPVRGTAHHLGTTRMAADPSLGVVDSRCRVYGVDNLYIGGSSVFPSGGWAFPTLTICALALRVAEDLHESH